MSKWIMRRGALSRKSLVILNTPLAGDSEEIPIEELEAGTAFLLAEFENLREFIQSSDNFTSRSADVLTAIVSALGAALGLLSQTTLGRRDLLYIMLLASGAILFISIPAFHQAIRRDIEVTNYFRALNRIRAYFAHRTPHIRSYLIMPISHKYPHYGSRSRGREVIIALNSLLISTLIMAIFVLLGWIVALDANAVIIGGVLFTFAHILQSVYAKQRFIQAEKKSQKHQDKDEELFGSYEKVRI